MGLITLPAAAAEHLAELLLTTEDVGERGETRSDLRSGFVRVALDAR